MKAQRECFECLRNQAAVHGVPMDQYDCLLGQIPKDENGASLHLTPPQIAIDLYAQIAKDLGKDDVFDKIKTQSIQKAYQLLQKIKIQDLSLAKALKLSALGNVIDYGSASAFCLQSFDFAKEFENLHFAHFCLETFESQLRKAKILVLLADNAGENLFDEVLLRVIAREYPKVKLYYFVRSQPIINDITLMDLQNHQECAGIFEVARVIDSGVKSAGFVYDDASLESKEIFDCADVILSKGMGNFECLEEKEDSRIFYLLKIKCQVVAKRSGFGLGEMLFWQKSFNL